MHEESDGINEIDNSEVVILPERAHVDESLLSDQSQIREEQNNYERKLDEKLRDLGLYEDDMTINQKEELLAVVVISCETAEQEENKRQLIREYLEGAQSLEDEIEFSFQESAWLANEANLLCSSTVSQSKNDIPSSSKISSSFADSGSSSGKNYDDGFGSVTQVEKTEFQSTPDIFEDETAYAEILLDPQTSSISETPSKKQIINKHSTKSKSRLGQSSCDANPKIAITHPMLQEQSPEKSKTGDLLDRQISLQRQKIVLDKSMGMWKPCMSPTDKPLSSLRSSKKKEENASYSATYDSKVNKYLSTFEKIASSFKTRRSFSSRPVHLSKPYVLLHHGSVAKRACKLDNYDYIVGVKENSQNNEEREENFIPCNTLTRAKSAFHRVKPNVHGRLLSFPDSVTQNDTLSRTTRSGAMYHSESLMKSEQRKSESPPEVLLEYTCKPPNEVSHGDLGFARGRLTGKRSTVNEDESSENDKRLPQFSDLRPEVCKYSSVVAPSPVNKRGSSQTETSVKYNCIPCTSNSSKPRKEHTLVNPEKDYSSDSSSPLIDVETIVDDEIEEFVMKRKLAPSTHKSSFINSSGESKKLKRNES